MTKNQKKGLIWIITPIASLLIVVTLFGILKLMQNITGAENREAISETNQDY